MKHSNKLTLMGDQQEVFQYHAARAEPREPDGGWRAEAKAGGARTCGRGARGSPASGMCETGREETMDGPETSRRRAFPPTGTPPRPLAHRRMPHPFGGHPRFGEYPRQARERECKVESGVRPSPQPDPAPTPGCARLLYGAEDTDAASAHPDTLSCIAFRRRTRT